MSDYIRLIAGLGNPGTRYRNTWHNLGWRVVELLADRWKCSFKPGKGEYFFAETPTPGGVTLLTPTSFMNRSGEPIGNWMRLRKIEPDRLLVIFDDHDLPLGSIRIREGGSAGGHNGMADIIRSLATDAIPRIRIGIRTESEYGELADQVLTAIPKRLKLQVEAVVSCAADAAETIQHDGVVSAANKYNGLTIL